MLICPFLLRFRWVHGAPTSPSLTINEENSRSAWYHGVALKKSFVCFRRTRSLWKTPPSAWVGAFWPVPMVQALSKNQVTRALNMWRSPFWISGFVWFCSLFSLWSTTLPALVAWAPLFAQLFLQDLRDRPKAFYCLDVLEKLKGVGFQWFFKTSCRQHQRR